MIEYNIDRKEKSLTLTINCIDEILLNSLNSHLIAVVHSYTKIKDLTTEHIIDVCCNYFQKSLEEIFNGNRLQELVQKRHVILYFLHGYSKESMSSISRRFSYLKGFDHATQIYAFKNVRKFISFDKNMAERVNVINDLLKTNYIKMCTNESTIN